MFGEKLAIIKFLDDSGWWRRIFFSKKILVKIVFDRRGSYGSLTNNWVQYFESSTPHVGGAQAVIFRLEAILSRYGQNEIEIWAKIAKKWQFFE